MQTAHTLSGGSSLPPPLRTAPDMPARWDDVELGFDDAAERLVQAHQRDGQHEDLPIADLRPLLDSYGIVRMGTAATPYEPEANSRGRRDSNPWTACTVVTVRPTLKIPHKFVAFCAEA